MARDRLPTIVRVSGQTRPQRDGVPCDEQVIGATSEECGANGRVVPGPYPPGPHPMGPGPVGPDPVGPNPTGPWAARTPPRILPAMRVGFDVTPLERRRGDEPRGLARVVEELVGKLEERGRVEVVRLAPADGEPLGRWRRRTLAAAPRREGLAGLHSFTSGFPPFGPGKRVQTVHELPWRHGVRENAGWRHRAWAALGPLFADRVVCATEHVARDLRRRWLPGAGRVRVCPWGVGPPFEEEPPPGTVDEVVLGRYRLPEDPLALCLAATRPKKNLAAVLQGLAEVRRRGGPSLHIVITGAETPQLRRDLGLASQLGLARWITTCLLYTSPSPRDQRGSRMPSSA